MSDAIELIERFCAEWGRGIDVETIVGYFTEDAVYHNIPVDPVTGHDGIRAMLAMFATGPERIEFRVANIVGDGNIVMTERVDVFVFADFTVELPVMGTFEVRDRKIAKWRDYFDLNQYMSQMQGAGGAT
jgi:limonene-1,2-epoxide hydrolase